MLDANNNLKNEFPSFFYTFTLKKSGSFYNVIIIIQSLKFLEVLTTEKKQAKMQVGRHRLTIWRVKSALVAFTDVRDITSNIM